jgi:CheY-like chemotaxis protein
LISANIVAATSDTLNVHFSVADTGIGIPEDKQAIIFEPFMQASKNTTRKFGGTGLGLAIVRLLLELQNSRIHIKSIPDKGTEFFFEMAFGYHKTPKSLKEGNKNKKPVDLGTLRILLVEDNHTNILFIKKLFANWDIDPVVAENGEEAVRVLENQDFDVILMDIHMPVMDGYEATKHIREMKDKKKAGIHIIAVTASVSHNARVSVKQAGLDDYVEKPFQIEELRRKLEKIYYDKIAGEL